MTLQASAISYGAISVVNAIATGKGAALGVDLWTKAFVKLTLKPGQFSVSISPDKDEDQTLARTVAKRVLRRFDAHKKFGAEIRTQTNIPIARGLKSSSSAANAVALATIAALQKRLPDQEVIRLGVEASLDSGVSITGAFDDACACYYGGFVATNNVKCKLIQRRDLRAKNHVLVAFPPQKSYTARLNRENLNGIRKLVEATFAKALEGQVWDALTLNGVLHAIALDYDPSPIFDAIRNGAIAAGLTGKGPAIAAIQDLSNHRVERVLRRVGRVIHTRLNSKRAHVLA